MLKAAISKVIEADVSELWSRLNGHEKRVILDSARLCHFRKGQIIYAEGDLPQYAWCLLRGKVKKYKHGCGGRQQIVRLVRPVQYFGYRAYFAGEPYVSSAGAMEATTVAAIPLMVVEGLIRKNMELAFFFIQEMARNLGEADARTVSLTQKHIRGRLADALMVMLDNYGYEPDGSTLNIFMSREDLANLSNMTTSNAIRTLSSFVSDHLLVVDGRRIKVLDEDRLRKISRQG